MYVCSLLHVLMRVFYLQLQQLLSDSDSVNSSTHAFLNTVEEQINYIHFPLEIHF